MGSYIKKALKTLKYFPNSGSSTYYNDRGQLVPRVTEIISRMNHSDGLMYWANSLGFKGIKYKYALDKAANIGTEAHSAIELFLKEKLETESNIPFLGFLQWYNLLTNEYNLSVNMVYSEYSLVCDWFGGTLDAIIDIGGKLYLIDFKTSNHVTYNYFLQLAAYIYMLKEKRIYVDGCIVLQLDKDEPGFNEYFLDFRNLSHLDFIKKCENTFLSLVYAYYNINKVECIFKELF